MNATTLRILVTGGSGFIGSALIRHLLAETGHQVLNLDKLTYAANPRSLADLAGHPRYRFEKADILDAAHLRQRVRDFAPDAIIHLAAESHVDRSIDRSRDFIETNVLGTHHLLEAARHYLESPACSAPDRFRLIHASTDEVFGELGEADARFREDSPYAPNSPYSASKAASDHLVRAWSKTHRLPTLTTHSSNNYGPRQFPEKLIPHMILNALHGRPLPIYGDGLQQRDWLFVEDHVAALTAILDHGRAGDSYLIGGGHEATNLGVVGQLCDLLDELAPARPAAGSFRKLITPVADRPGHDRRYASDASRIARDLGWRPTTPFASGLRRTVAWYLENDAWWRPLLSGDYQLGRLGIGNAG